MGKDHEMGKYLERRKTLKKETTLRKETTLKKDDMVRLERAVNCYLAKKGWKLGGTATFHPLSGGRKSMIYAIPSLVSCESLTCKKLFFFSEEHLMKTAGNIPYA